MNSKERAEIKYEIFSRRIEVIEQFLYRNKIGNYTPYVMKFIAWIIVKFQGKKVVEFSYNKEKWLHENLKIIQFRRSLAFLKSKDFIQVVFKKENLYRIIYLNLKYIVSKSIELDVLLETDEYFVKTLEEKKYTLSKEKKKREKKEKKKNQKEKKDKRKEKEKIVEIIGALAPRNKKIIKKNDSSEIIDNKRFNSDPNQTEDRLIDNVTSTLSYHNQNSSNLSALELIRESKRRNQKGKRKKRLRKDSIELYGYFKLNPSENPKLNGWRNREIDKWRSIDFLGYYVYLYREELGMEMISLQNDQAYLKVKLSIRKILESWFGKDREIFKEYIKWAVKYFVSSKDVKSFAPSIDVIFNLYRTWVYDKFVKLKKNQKRKHDKKWARLETWKEKERNENKNE